MYSAFFGLAMLSPGRQMGFRRAVTCHVLVLFAGACFVLLRGAVGGVTPLPLLGQLLLVTGIVEGATLVGWRLTQVPKSRSLEFLLASPLKPGRVFLAEAYVGLARLALVTLAGLPLLVGLVLFGVLGTPDLVTLTVMPFTWGAVTGLALTQWAYEPVSFRQWSERVMLVLVIFYLVVGVLVGEHLKSWLTWLPADLGLWVLNGFTAFHRYNPFAVMQYWMEGEPVIARERAFWLELAGLGLVGLLLTRAAVRLKGHFHERHYKPRNGASAADTRGIGDRPLSWWAVRRVLEYSGRVNLWLAGGFGLIYASYTAAGPAWPDWLGRRVFQIVEIAGGIPTVATALVVLAAVPAAFQYGLWDHNAQDRCRRLELLLLTELNAGDYWHAAAAAAWRRGRGYLAVSALLWTSAALAGRIGWPHLVYALAGGVILWGLYFAVGFRMFSRGHQANGLGMLLTVGMPLLAFLLRSLGFPGLAALTPPGFVYYAATRPPSQGWLWGMVLGALAMWYVAQSAQTRCEAELRDWFEQHHGRKTMD